MSAKRGKLYLIDAHAYLHRAFHALHAQGRELTNSKGMDVTALYGLARQLLTYLKKDKPDYMVVCFDLPEPTFRHEKFEEYKATRTELDEALIPQLDMAEDVVDAMGIKTAAKKGFEADDVMATLADQGKRAGLDVIIVTDDKDILQMVDDKVRVLNSRRGLMGPGEVAEKFGVGPERIVDYLGLVGDASDNVPGVAKVGAKTAVDLISKFGGIPEILKAAKAGKEGIKPAVLKSLQENEETANLSRELVELERKVPLGFKPTDGAWNGPKREKLDKIFRELEFTSLLKEIGGNGNGSKTPAKKELSLSAFAKAAKKAGRVSVVADDEAEALFLSLPTGEATTADPKKDKVTLGALLGEKFETWGHDVKALRIALKARGISVAAPYNDTALMAYVVNPSRPNFDLATIALEHLGGDPLADEDPAAQAAALWDLSKALEAEMKEKKVDSLYRDVELPLLDMLAGMEEAGVGIDVAFLKKIREKVSKGLVKIKGEIDKIAGGEINVNSPKQLAELLFGKLGLPVQKKTKTGFSTNEEVLRILSPMHPVPEKILKFRELTKLKSTYLDHLIEEPVKGRIHTVLNQTGTATGRLSSQNPNLQNIPVRTELGREIRRGFVPAKGRTLVSADYSQIDLRVLAHLCKDEALVKAFRTGEDVHRLTASEIFHCEPSKVDDAMRRQAKAVNFGVVYGQTPHGLSRELGISFPEAKRYIDHYFERYPGVKTWMKATIAAAKQEGSVRTLLGRVRYLPDIKAKNPAVRQYAERTAINTPVQGTSADVIKVAMLKVRDRIASLPAGKRPEVLLQVHDDLLLEVPNAAVSVTAGWLKEVMESAMGLDVPVVVDVKTGKNWADMEAFA